MVIVVFVKNTFDKELVNADVDIGLPCYYWCYYNSFLQLRWKLAVFKTVIYYVRQLLLALSKKPYYLIDKCVILVRILNNLKTRSISNRLKYPPNWTIGLNSSKATSADHSNAEDEKRDTNYVNYGPYRNTIIANAIELQN